MKPHQHKHDEERADEPEAFDTQRFVRNVAGQGKFILDWRNWGYGLISGVIFGAASSTTAWVGEAIAKGAGADIHLMNWKELGIVALSSGVFAGLAYLKQSPLPPKIAVTTKTKTVTATQTTETKTTVSTEPPAPKQEPAPENIQKMDDGGDDD